MAEKHQVDKSIDELVDIRDVKLDSSLGQAERIQSFLQQIKNPYCIRVGDDVVKVAYTEGGPTQTDCIADMLSLLCGLT